MDDIARLLGDLCEGRLTAAVPLLDLLAERGLEWEADRVREAVGVWMYAARPAGPAGGYMPPSRLRARVRAEMRKYLWHLMPDRDATLAEAEAWTTGPDPEPPANIGDGEEEAAESPPNPPVAWFGAGGHLAGFTPAPDPEG